MGVDIGIGSLISRTNETDGRDRLGIVPAIMGSGWSVSNAIAWSGMLQGTQSDNQIEALRRYLSVYALTQMDAISGNGTYDDISFVNGDDVRKALFGSGNQDDQSLIQNTWVGGRGTNQNPYAGVRTVLEHLGFNNTKYGYTSYPHTYTMTDHNNHFHVDLRPPELVSIRKSESLLADNEAVATDVAHNDAISQLAETAISDLDLVEKDLTMLIIPSQMPVAMIAQSINAQASSEIRRIGVCHIVPNRLGHDTKSAENAINPKLEVLLYLEENDLPKLELSDVSTPVVKTEPTHGKLVADGAFGYSYVPASGYFGYDKAIIDVTVDGRLIKLFYYFQSIDSMAIGNTTYDDLCLKGDSWKISFSPGSFKPYLPLVGLVSSLESVQSKLDVTMRPSIRFDSLPDGVLSETRGTEIVLSPLVSGNGWFIDGTPTSNEEFLPTSNANEWIARPEGIADGKVDMLSVLLHEYGHALGLDHSLDSHDFMAPTLQPGVRHVLSEADLAEISQLAGLPAPDPGQPLPSLPYDLSLMALALRRKQAADGILADANANGTALGALAPSIPHYDVVSNPALTNGDFSDAGGWTTSGNVTVANGSVVLGESTDNQTRVNQVFTVNPNDHFLRFTISGLNLQSPGNGPQDAFEVALLDATSGQSLATPVALSNTDDFLNLQGDGSSFMSSGLSFTTAPDGSRTYVLDLSNIAAGTAVNLSFDLIGFGDPGSHVTISHVRADAGVARTLDDAATGSEDTALTIVALANDIGIDEPGFVPVLVSGPARGQITVNVDGTFGYSPDKEARPNPWRRPASASASRRR